VSPADQESSYRAIERLIATYAELVDDGDFAAVGRLLAHAMFTGAAGTVSGADAIEKMLRDNVIVYDDVTPRTKHLTTNLAIEVDEEASTAVSRAYFTALQAAPGLPLQLIVSGRYHDRFERGRRKVAFRSAARPNRPRRQREPPSASLSRRPVVLAPRWPRSIGTRRARVPMTTSSRSRDPKAFLPGRGHRLALRGQEGLRRPRPRG
jgi:hypothetical protein